MNKIALLALASTLTLAACATPPSNDEILKEPVALTVETTKSADAYSACLQESWNRSVPHAPGAHRYPAPNGFLVRNALSDVATVTTTAKGARVEYRQPAGVRITALTPEQDVRGCI